MNPHQDLVVDLRASMHMAAAVGQRRPEYDDARPTKQTGGPCRECPGKRPPDGVRAQVLADALADRPRSAETGRANMARLLQGPGFKEISLVEDQDHLPTALGLGGGQ